MTSPHPAVTQTSMHNLRSGEEAAKIHRKWQAAVDRAASDLERITTLALANYEAEVHTGAAMLERQLDLADRVRRAVMGPAQAAYDRQVALADRAIDDILKPAQAEFDRIVAQAEAGWQAVYPEAIKAYQNEIEAANRVRNAAQLGHHKA